MLNGYLQEKNKENLLFFEEHDKVVIYLIRCIFKKKTKKTKKLQMLKKRNKLK